MSVSLKPLPRPRALADQVYASLREHLRSGAAAPDVPLTEVALAQELGVSRTPVREALTRLAGEGLVQASGRSFVVPAVDAIDIDEIYALRRLLEPEAVRLVATAGLAKAALAPLEAALKASVAADRARDVDAFIQANGAFRAAWLALVTNRRLVKAIEINADHVNALRRLTLASGATRRVVLGGLKSIYTAIASDEGDAAADAMRAHLVNAERFLREALAAQSSHRKST